MHSYSILLLLRIMNIKKIIQIIIIIVIIASLFIESVGVIDGGLWRLTRVQVRPPKDSNAKNGCIWL